MVAFVESKDSEDVERQTTVEAHALEKKELLIKIADLNKDICNFKNMVSHSQEKEKRTQERFEEMENKHNGLQMKLSVQVKQNEKLAKDKQDL